MLTVCLAGLTFTGCSRQLTTNAGIDSPVVLKYWVNNPLNCEEINESSGQGFDYSYIRVTGLKDKEIEKAVNDRIKAVYDGLRIRDIPPYRGIRAKIPEGSVLQNESIYVNTAGNFNNILSVVLSKYVNYQDPDPGEYKKDPAYYDGSKYFSETETLNFDLNTGKEIALKDLFCDNVDYMQLVNDRMGRFLSENYAEDEGYYVGSIGEIKQVESFKGLAEDQQFAVYPYGIGFVFDYRTPQFETGGMAVCPLIYYSEFGDNIAVLERFFRGKESIFTSEESAVKTFVIKDAKNDIAGNEYFQDGSINIYQSWSYSSTLPEEIREKLGKMRAVDQAKVKEIKQKYGGMTESGIADSGTGACEVMAYGERMGDFINVSRYSNVYLPDYYEQVTELHCYDGETLEELELEDIFQEGYDYKPAVMEAISSALNSYDGTYEEDSGGKYSDQQLEEVFSRISGFNLAADAVIIPILHPEKGNQTYGLTVYIPYKDLGCDNMNIFR